MDSGLLLDQLPLWLLFVLSLGLILLTWEAGYRVAGRATLREGGEEPFASEILGAVLGLLAFVLALTVSLAADRYGDRQDLAAAEVEAIRVAFLNAGYAEEPERSQLRAVLQSYVGIRLGPLERPDQVAEMHRRSMQAHAELSRLGERVGRGPAVSDVRSSLVTSLHDIQSLHHRRLRLGTISRTPPSVVFTLVALMAIAMFGLGWRARAAASRRRVSLAAFALSISLLMVLISWLDRPKNGLVRQNQQLLRGLQEWMVAQPTTGAQAAP